MGIKRGFSHTFIGNNCNPTGEIDRYIGTSYDVVKTVYENLDAINNISKLVDSDLDAIEQNTLDIAAIKVEQTTQDSRLDTLEAKPDYDDSQVTADIATNASNILINTSAINTNTSNISLSHTWISNKTSQIGVSENATDLGLFSGSIISDNNTVKGALQEIEIKLDSMTSTIDLDIENLQTAVNLNSSAITTLDSRVDSNDLDITDLQNNKVDKEFGKGLSEDNFTTLEKTKLSNIEDGANATVINDSLTSTSTTEGLSANQGNVLKTAQDALDTRLTAEENKEVIDTTARSSAASAQSTADSNTTLISTNASNISQNASDISALDTRLTTEENKEVVDTTARSDATQALLDASNAQTTANSAQSSAAANTTNLSNLIQDLIDIQGTHAAVGNTVSDNTGNPNPSGTLTVSFTGTNDALLTPPVSPQFIASVDLNGYIKIPLEFISQSGFLSDNGDGGILVGIGGSGNYETPHAWLDMSSSVNGNNVGFVFGILRGSQIIFSQRVTGGLMSTANNRTNISGGGFVDGLQEGDIIYVYGSAEKTSTVTIYDANLGLSMKKKA